MLVSLIGYSLVLFQPPFRAGEPHDITTESRPIARLLAMLHADQEVFVLIPTGRDDRFIRLIDGRGKRLAVFNHQPEPSRGLPVEVLREKIAVHGSLKSVSVIGDSLLEFIGRAVG